jgi:quinolinate synthase
MGECHVHKNINAHSVNARRAEHENAEVLVHPECGCAGQVIYEMGLGDVDSEGVHITSTEGMIRRVCSTDASSFIVATEVGILHRMQQLAPHKQFYAADPEAQCAFMKTITLESVRESLVHTRHVVDVPPEIRRKAIAALDRMVSIGGTASSGGRKKTSGRSASSVS